MSVPTQTNEKTTSIHSEQSKIVEILNHEKGAEPVEIALDAEANIPPVAQAVNEFDVEPPPNGGWHAWLQVLGSWFLFFNGWGTVNAFGVFQTYYMNNPYWERSASDISWIGSVQAFLLLMVGVVSGPLYDAGYFRHLVSAGAFLVPFGFLMTSLCRTYWQTMLAQAVVVGIGNGCLFVPSVAILPQYFSTKKALANGLAASGSSVGGIVYPIVFRQLQQRIGFAWATRVVAFIALIGLLFSLFVMKPRIMPKGKRKLTQFAAFKEVPYSLFNIAMFFAFIGFYGPVYYIQTYAITTGITSVTFGFYLLPILNAASVPGRIIPNFITDYVGPLNVLVPASLATGILALAWAGIHNIGGTIAFCVLYGFVSGAMISLPPLAIVSLTKDMRYIGTRMGQCFFCSSFGLLIGSPVAGAIYSHTGKFIGLQLFSGMTLFLTAVLLIATRVAAVGLVWKIKA